MELPDQIHIRTLPFAVKHIDDLHSVDDEGHKRSLYGACDQGSLEIRLLPDMHPAFERGVVMHEVVHAILFAASNFDHDETLVDQIGYGIIEVLRSNPQLVAYIMEGIPCAAPSS